MTSVPRYADGSRVPGWDEAADLRKAPAEIPDPALVEVPAALREEIVEMMERYPQHRSAAIGALTAAQRHHGWLSPEAIEQVASVMALTPGYLVAVASFYDMFELRPTGRNAVYVCTNISCTLCGAEELFDAIAAAAAEDPTINLRRFECLGACDIAPMVSVNGEYFGPLAPADGERLIEDLAAGRPPLPELALALRPSADPNASST